MKTIKFRQPIFIDGKFDHWHYWGFVNNQSLTLPLEFISPEYHLLTCFGGSPGPTLAEAQASSQQYADLKDKDGKELNWWEGDILGIKDEALYEIVKDKGCFWAKGIGRMETHKPLLYDLASELFTVIGNDIENPELLEKGS